MLQGRDAGSREVETAVLSGSDGFPGLHLGHRAAPNSQDHTSSSSMRRSVSLMNLMYWLVSVVSSL